MKTSITHLTVAIITKDRLHDLRECLDSLMIQLERGDECIIVDSGSSEETHNYILRFNHHSRYKILYIHEPRRGFPIARNRAIRASRNTWIAFTDDDCIVDTQWVKKLKLAIRKHPDATAIAGLSLTLYPENPVALSCELNENYWKTKGRIESIITDFETLDNKNVVYSLKFFTKHHITYDESRTKRFSGASDDCDLGMQIQAAGGTAFYTPDAIVFHKDPTSLATFTVIKINRTLAHAAYEEKWSEQRKSFPPQRLNKWTYIADFIKQKHISNKQTLQLLWCLCYTFVLIRYAKSVYWLTNNANRKKSLIILAFILILVLLRKPANKEQSINYFLNNPQRTAYYSSVTTKPDWWRLPIEGKSVSAPVVYNNTLFVGGTFPYLYAFDLQTGKERWRFQASDDVPFSPTINNNTVYIASVDGIIYALDFQTGEEKWRFHTENYYQIATTPVVEENRLFAGAYDGNMYALDSQNGHVLWKYHTNGFIESSPVEWEHTIYFGSYDGYLYAIDAGSGKEKWKYKTRDKIIASPSLQGRVIYIGSRDGYLYALHADNGTYIWKTNTRGAIDAPASVAGNTIFVGNKNNILSAISVKNGKVLWTRHIRGGVYAAPAIAKNSVYYTSFDHSIYALDSKTGKTQWSYATQGELWGTAAITPHALYFVSNDGYLYALDPNMGKPVANLDFSVTAPKSVGWRDILEITIRHNDLLYDSPSTQASFSAQFTGPNGSVFQTSAFYYDHNIWKIRFSPNDAGKWKWSVTLTITPTVKITKTGTFTCTSSDNNGFLYLDPSNVYRLLDEKGNLFHPLGIEDSVLDTNNSGSPLDDFGLDEKTTDLSTYAHVYGKSGAGFNMFRWGVENSSFPLWAFDKNWNIMFPVTSGAWGDQLVQTLRKEGFRIWMSLFAFTPIGGSSQGKELDADKETIRRYLRYAVARYGAYVDVWELSNEATLSKEWVEFTSQYLKSIDPYNHLIAMSWEWQYPDIDAISVTAPHWYENEPETESDTRTESEIASRRWGKPIVFGEQGNQYANWDDRSAIRMRIRLWTAFFREAGIIFWNTSGTKHFVHQKNANIYLGPVERQSVHVFQSFETGADPAIQIRPIETDYQSGSRIYILQSDKEVLGYIHHFQNHDLPVSSSVTLTVNRDASIFWVDPESGKAVRVDDLTAGTQTIQSPLFIIDIAFKYEHS